MNSNLAASVDAPTPFLFASGHQRRRTAERRADPRLDGIDELLTAETGVIFERLFDAVPVPQLGEQLRQLSVSLEFTFEKYAIEIEDDRLEIAHQSSNNAVPTRTEVAPSMTAAS